MPLPKEAGVDSTKQLSKTAAASAKAAKAATAAEASYQRKQAQVIADAVKTRGEQDRSLQEEALADLGLHGDAAKARDVKHRPLVKRVETRANRDHLGSDVMPLMVADEFGVQALHTIGGHGEDLKHAGINAYQGKRKVKTDMAEDHLGIGLGHMEPDKEHDMNEHAFREMQGYGEHVRDVAHQIRRERADSGKTRPYSTQVQATIRRHEGRVPSHLVPAKSHPHLRGMDHRTKQIKLAVTPPWLSPLTGRDADRFKRKLCLPNVK